MFWPQLFLLRFLLLQDVMGFIFRFSLFLEFSDGGLDFLVILIFNMWSHIVIIETWCSASFVIICTYKYFFHCWRCGVSLPFFQKWVLFVPCVTEFFLFVLALQLLRVRTSHKYRIWKFGFYLVVLVWPSNIFNPGVFFLMYLLMTWFFGIWTH